VTLTLRPLTIGELLDRTFVYYRQHLMMFVGIAALPHLFVLVYQIAVLTLRPTGPGAALAPLLGAAVGFIASTFSYGAIVIAVSEIQLDRPIDIGEAFARIRSQVGEVIVLSLNIGVRVLIGTILLIVPGILQALKYALAIPVAILEQDGVSASLSRSADLTRGDRGRIFVIYLLFAVLFLVLTMLWQVPAMFMLGFRSARTGVPPTWTAQTVILFGGFITEALLSPIMTIGLTLVYYDERVRKEAFDLEHMMHEIDRKAGDSAPA
jgi:hypothetical protein